MRLSLADAAQIECRVLGPAGGVPLLFVHGFPLDGTMWEHAAHALSDRFRCIVPDLRGFGKSTMGPPTTITIATYADDCIRVLGALGEARPAVFVGLSMGGIILYELYRRHASRVRALVLCNTRANAESEEGKKTREERARLVEERGEAGVHAVADSMIAPVLAPGVSREVRERVLAMMRRTPASGLAAASRALAGRGDSWGTLGTIRVPTLYIAGDRDQVTPLELMRELHAGTPASRLAVIEGSGHLPPVESPDAFVEALRCFLDGVPVAG